MCYRKRFHIKNDGKIRDSNERNQLTNARNKK